MASLHRGFPGFRRCLAPFSHRKCKPLRGSRHLCCDCAKKGSSPPPLLRLGRLPVSGLESDDLAPQLRRSPARFRRLESCRYIKLNQFRHRGLLAGTRTPPSKFFVPPAQECDPAIVHLSPLVWCYSVQKQVECHIQKHENKGRVVRPVRESTQLSERRVRWRNPAPKKANDKSFQTNGAGFTVRAVLLISETK